jgi:NAD(P)-dependent dehydrogenase (short-subunit alcohol dehydrogenase family)
MNLGISARVALVTGASAGIGFAIAKEFVENHVSVIIVARGDARLRADEALTRRRMLASSSSISLKSISAQRPGISTTFSLLRFARGLMVDTQKNSPRLARSHFSTKGVTLSLSRVAT